jgi:hypothetical protein
MAAYYEPGLYHVRIEDQGLTSASTGRPMIVFRVKVLAKVDETQVDLPAYTVPQMHDRTIRLVVGEEESTQEYVLSKLRYAGWTGNRFETMQLVGYTCQARCRHGSYNGQSIEDWDLSLPPREPKPLPRDPTVARKLNTIFGRRLREATPFPAASTAPV